MDELVCTICLHIFVRPVTRDCGHTFCRECLSSTCPLCVGVKVDGRWHDNVVLCRMVANIPTSCRTCDELMPRGDYADHQRNAHPPPSSLLPSSEPAGFFADNDWAEQVETSETMLVDVDDRTIAMLVLVDAVYGRAAPLFYVHASRRASEKLIQRMRTALRTLVDANDTPALDMMDDLAPHMAIRLAPRASRCEGRTGVFEVRAAMRLAVLYRARRAQLGLPEWHAGQKFFPLEPC